MGGIGKVDGGIWLLNDKTEYCASITMVGTLG